MNSFMKLYRYLKKVSIFVKKMKNPLKKNIFDFCLEYDFLNDEEKIEFKKYSCISNLESTREECKMIEHELKFKIFSDDLDYLCEKVD